MIVGPSRNCIELSVGRMAGPGQLLTSGTSSSKRAGTNFATQEIEAAEVRSEYQGVANQPCGGIMIRLAVLVSVGATLVQAEVATDRPAESWLRFITGGHELVDYSYAGYELGEAKIPDVEGPVFEITDYGAIANDGESDHSAIQAAIDAAAMHGGVVKFPEGRFITHTENDDYNDAIWIRGSNVVLRGAGRDKTVVLQLEPTTMQPAYGFWQFKAEPIPLPRKETKKIRIAMDAYRGSKTISLTKKPRLQEGDWVTLSAHLKDHAAIEPHIYPFKPTKKHKLKELGRVGLEMQEVHRVESVSGTTVNFRYPILIDIIQSSENWTMSKKSMITNVGIEDIEFRGRIPLGYQHHDGNDSTWSAVALRSCGNCWIRRVRFRDVSRGFQISGGNGVTVRDVIFEGRNGHYNAMIKGGRGVLVTNLADLAGQHHGPSISHGGVGHVYHRVIMQPNQSIDIHKTDPSRYNLYDMILGGRLDKSSGGGVPPRHQRGLTFWNFCNGTADVHYTFKSNNLILPNIIGLHGEGSTVDESTVSILESLGEPVFPESLYEAQLKRRLSLQKNKLSAEDNAEAVDSIPEIVMLWRERRQACLETD